MNYEDTILFENFDYANAFIGISESNQAIYNFDKMVDCLVKEQEKVWKNPYSWGIYGNYGQELYIIRRKKNDREETK